MHTQIANVSVGNQSFECVVIFAKKKKKNQCCLDNIRSFALGEMINAPVLEVSNFLIAETQHGSKKKKKKDISVGMPELFIPAQHMKRLLTP